MFSIIQHFHLFSYLKYPCFHIRKLSNRLHATEAKTGITHTTSMQNKRNMSVRND